MRCYLRNKVYFGHSGAPIFLHSLQKLLTAGNLYGSRSFTYFAALRLRSSSIAA